MKDIVHKIRIQAPVAKVYRAIATLDGLKGWWTTNLDGTCRERGTLIAQFGDEKPVMDVVDLLDGEMVKWRCRGGVEEWTDTILTFELEEKDGVTELLFAHLGWADQTDFFAHCNTQWAVYMLSLRDFCEHDEGHPYPDHVRV